MRRLLFSALFVFSVAQAQSVTQTEPTALDLAALMGELVVIEVKVPEGANTLRVATVMGMHRASDSQIRLAGFDREPSDAVRFVLRIPGELEPECPGEPVDVAVRLQHGHNQLSGSCSPTAVDRRNPRLVWSKHEHVISSAEPEIGVWTLLYVRAWTSSELRPVSGASPYFEPSEAFMLQALFMAEDLNDLAGGEGPPVPLGEDALRGVPELSYRLEPN